MKSKKQWDFAQAYAGKRSVWYGAFVILVGIIILFVDVPIEYGIAASPAMIVAVLVLLMQSENAIKRKFIDQV